MNTSTSIPAAKWKILVIDDEPHQRHIMSEAIKVFGYTVQAYASAQEILEQAKSGSWDVLVTDLKMPEMSGMELLERVREIDPTLSVIVVTAHGTIETAVEAIRKGAEDYVTKPVDFGALEIALNRVFKRRELIKEMEKLVNQTENLKREIGIRYHLTSAIGISPEAIKLHKNVETFTKNWSPLIIFGEAGVGKSNLARMIHYNGPMAANVVLHFDCGAIPEELHESQLFGEERGETSVPSAIGHPGLVEKAHLGTLIISKIHLLSRACQSRLLAVLKNHQSQRVNGRETYHTHVRIIATSNREDFDKAGASGRKDLHDFLLQNFIVVPPLRSRKEDIPLLALAIVRKLAPMYGKKVDKIDKALAAELTAYDFPGNYRELETLIESAVIKIPVDAEILTSEYFRNFKKAGG